MEHARGIPSRASPVRVFPEAWIRFDWQGLQNEPAIPRAPVAVEFGGLVLKPGSTSWQPCERKGMHVARLCVPKANGNACA